MAVESSTDGDGGEARSRRARFREWRSRRPFAGGVMLLVAGILIGYVPMQFAFELLLVGGSYTYIGLLWAVGVFLTGAFVLYRPEFSTIFGVIGVVLSILSLLGALGGLLIGMIVGIVGGNLCVAWSAPEPRGESRREGSGDDRPAVRTDGGTTPDKEPPAEPGAETRLAGLAATIAATGPLSRLRSDGGVFGAEPREAYLDRVRRHARRTAREASGALDRARSSADPGRIADAATSGWTTKRLAMTFALLVVTSGTLTLVSTIPAAAILGDHEDTTYTVDVGEIRLGEGGQICAASVGSDAYRVTITDATLVDATIYQQRGGEAVKTNFPELAVEDTMVMYTTSDDEQLELLASTVGCTDEDQTSRTVFRNDYQQSSLLRGSQGVTMLNMEAVDGSIPEPGGFQFAGPEDNESSTADNVTDVGNVSDDVRAVADTIDDVINSTLEDRLRNDTGELDDLEKSVDETVEDVNETADPVDDTVGGVDDTVDSVDDTIEDAASGPADAANATGDVTNATEDAVSSVEESVENTTRRAADGEPPENASGAVDGTTDAVDNTTGEVTGTTDDVTDATDEATDVEENRTGGAVDESTDAVDGTTETVENTTDEVTDGVDETTEEVTGSTGETATSTATATETEETTTTTDAPVTETTTTDAPVTETTTAVPTATPEDDAALPDWFDQVDEEEQESVLETVEETAGDFDDVSNVTAETDHLSEDAIRTDENLTQLDNGTVLLLNGTEPVDIDWGSDVPVETEVSSITSTETETEVTDGSDSTETQTDSEDSETETDSAETQTESDSDDGTQTEDDSDGSLFLLAG